MFSATRALHRKKGAFLNVVFASRRNPAERNKLNRKVINLIAVAERNDGYADVPPGSIDDEIECELAVYGYAIAHSDVARRVQGPLAGIHSGRELQVARSTVNIHLRVFQVCTCPRCSGL